MFYLPDCYIYKKIDKKILIRKITSVYKEKTFLLIYKTINNILKKVSFNLEC